MTNLYKQNRRWTYGSLQQTIPDETISDDIKTALRSKKDIFYHARYRLFQKYNDIYGHQKGDEAIKAVARAIIDVFDKENEKVYRLGEEFGVLGMSDPAEEYIKKNQKPLGLKYKN